MTPLVNAIKSGRESEAIALIAAGADACQTNPSNHTPLLLAAQRGQTRLVLRLIEAGAEIDSQDMDRGLTPLIAAVLGCYPDATRALLDADAGLEKMTHEGRNALCAARRSLETRGENSAARQVLEHLEAALKGRLARAEPSSLRLAAAVGDGAALEALLEQGVGHDVPDHWNTAAVSHASINGHARLVGRLIALGADVTRVTRRRVYFERMTFHDALGWAIFRDHPEVIAVMAASSIEFNRQDLRGETPLMRAARWGRVGAARALIEGGADLGLRNRRSQRAVDVAAEASQPALVEVLEANR